MKKARKRDAESGRKGSTKSRSKTPTKSHLHQLAGYHRDGQKVATLRELLDPSVPTMSLSELTEDQRVNLIVSRLRNEPDNFRIGIIGPGIIDKTRAIAEVEARSRIGRTIMEIEQNTLRHLGETK